MMPSCKCPTIVNETDYANPKKERNPYACTVPGDAKPFTCSKEKKEKLLTTKIGSKVVNIWPC